MSDELDALRAEIAHAHGLAPDAAAFLVGTTVNELEQSATELARLTATTEQKQPGRFGETIRQSLAEKGQRQQQLLDIITGRARARDSRGRFASQAHLINTDPGLGRGFDGGARTPAPAPPQTHDEWLSEVLRTRSADRGADF